MKTNNETRKRKFLALFLSLMMAASTAVAFASCNNDDNSDDDGTTEEEEVVLDDDSPINNGTFSAYTNKDGLTPIGKTVTGWSKSTYQASSGSAVSSDAESGVIDVSDDGWQQLTGTGIDVAPNTLTEKQAEELWSSMTARDKLEYYKAWKDNDDNDDRKITDLSFYQTFTGNVDADDLPFVKDDNGNKTFIANPGTHQGATDSEILMIHNEKTTANYLGTAQKYTSSSTVTVKAGSSAKFSVWVKTSNLVGSASGNEKDETAHNKGAYIQITHTVGGKTLEPLEVKNIQAAEWTQYEFVLRGSYYADTTFTMVLGLGQSGGSNKNEYVNGFAFFDDVECEVLEEATAIESGYETFTLSDTTAKTVLANKTDNKKYALDFYGDGDLFTADTTALDGWTFAPTTQNGTNGQQYTSVNPANFSSSLDADAKVWQGLGSGLDTTDDKYQVFDSVQSLNGLNATATAVYNHYFKDTDFLTGTTDKALVFLSKKGAAYKADSSAITVPADSYLAISFFVKTSEMNGYTGAGITLKDADKKALASINSIDTTTVERTDSDQFDGWQQVFFFLHNETDADKKVSFTFNFGQTSIVGVAKDAYYAGFASFAGFKKNDGLTKAEFECATNGTYTKLVTLSEEDESSSDAFDTAANLNSANIEKGFATPMNYTGVYSDSAFVGGGTDLSSNLLATAGLINKEYADNYGDIFTDLAAMGVGSTWETAFGKKATQPLVIYNTTASDKSYGFIGKKTTISANTYKAISLRVKTNATANIYLVDMDDDSSKSLLSIGRKTTYWYDADGNVCVSDPTDTDNFDVKTDIAFKLDSTTGLYKVNKNWSGATDIPENRYYANLAAYTLGTGANANHLMLGEGATEYAYYDEEEVWKHDGNDGIAFYNYNASNKTAYAYSDSAKQTDENLVYDFSTANVPTRYDAEESKDMYFTVSNTGNDWATVTFYVHTGDTAKNYRLEIWNGARNGQGGMAANTFVAVDSYSPDDPDATGFADLITEIKEDKAASTYETFDGVFSFYDSGKFLRYDETLNNNDVENAYDSYNSTSYTASTAYLRYAEGNVYELYADYATSETTVTVDAAEDEGDDDGDDDSDDGDTNVWMLISSIAVAAVLVVAVASLIIRKMVSSSRKKRGIYKK